MDIIRKKIIESIKKIKGNNFDYTENLVTDGLISSFDLISIVNDLEQKFKIKIPLEKITPEDFDSIAVIENLMKQLV